MKISAINTIKNNYFTQNRPVSFKQGQDIFVRSSKKSPKTFEEIINNKRKFEISDYKSLKPSQIEEAKKLADDTTIYTVEENLFAGKLVKKYLDKTYGKNKYVFACIGTSPSGIGRVLEFMGVETKYFPATNFRAYQYISDYLDKNPETENKYLSFLYEQGINEENIKNNNKTILFVDYTHRGETLKCFENFIKNRAKIDNKKIEYVSLNDIFTESLPVKDFNEDYFRLCDYLTSYLAYGRMAEYAGIPHLELEQFKDIDTIINKNTEEAPALFNLLLIDELKKQGKLKENPKNRRSL